MLYEVITIQLSINSAGKAAFRYAQSFLRPDSTWNSPVGKVFFGVSFVDE